MTTALAPYEVRAANLSAASENKIHDDTVARRFGFAGALVPGIEVFAYTAHVPVGHFGRAFLERGEAECRFLKPVYDGNIACVTAQYDGDGLALTVESNGERCATGSASMPAPRPAPAVDSLPAGTPPAERPKASEDSLSVGRALGIAPHVIDRTALATYLDAISETDPLYRAEGIVHPGQILRLANQALLQNVVLGPWIHVGSTIRFHSIARVGETLTLRSRVISNAVNKGHAIVTFDAIVVASGTRTVAAINHTAIWRPRQVALEESLSAKPSRGYRVGTIAEDDKYG
jgi:acyl dehydratase